MLGPACLAALLVHQTPGQDSSSIKVIDFGLAELFNPMQKFGARRMMGLECGIRLIVKSGSRTSSVARGCTWHRRLSHLALASCAM